MITVHKIRPFRQNSHEMTAEQSEFVRYWQTELEKLPTEQILRWSFEMFGPKLALVTSCSVGGSVLISMLGEMKTEIPVISADADGRFGETKRLYESLAKKYGVRIDSDYTSIRNGLPLCCGGKKFKTLNHRAARYDAWISEEGRDRFPDRLERSIIDWDERFGLFRIMPLARWTRQSILDKAIRESIPFDEYADQDYFNDECYDCLYGRKNKENCEESGCCCKRKECR